MSGTGNENTAAEAWSEGDAPPRAVAPPDDGGLLIIDIDGFEGPLDLLLELARHHKIDLKHISILKLAEQYLAFIEKARRLQLELAADYLVMAAWLAYLKSRLLIPVPPGMEEAEPEDLAARLAFRLQRLQAMRTASENLMARSVLGRDVFARGSPEPLVLDTKREYADNLIDLLKAYAERPAEDAAADLYGHEAADLVDQGSPHRPRASDGCDERLGHLRYLAGGISDRARHAAVGNRLDLHGEPGTGAGGLAGIAAGGGLHAALCAAKSACGLNGL